MFPRMWGVSHPVHGGSAIIYYVPTHVGSFKTLELQMDRPYNVLLTCGEFHLSLGVGVD